MPDTLFVTGKLAAPALAATLAAMRPQLAYKIAVLPMTVAALMNTAWIARHLPDARGCASVMLPGLCQGDTAPLAAKLGVPVLRGPADLKDLPIHFGGSRDLSGYGPYRTQILAEITEAHVLPPEAVLARARYLRDSGADIIDLGGPPSGPFPGVGDVVALLRVEGFRVSIDSFDAPTILAADRAGAELVLSVNSANLEVAKELRATVVVIPDFGEGMESLEHNAAKLRAWGVPHILDPILDPIGLSESLWRFRETRRRHPEAPMLMGLGNVTELTEADSPGVTAVLAGVLAELGIDYALTTEVASWTRGAVRELDLARRIMHYAVASHVPARGIDDGLLVAKPAPHAAYDDAELREIQSHIRDNNIRIFVGGDRITVLRRDLFLQGDDPATLFARLGVTDPGHAFYLGRELERAATAVRLGKKYVQDAPLSFGYRTRPTSPRPRETGRREQPQPATGRTEIVGPGHHVGTSRTPRPQNGEGND
jgi:dihydropteroate synthase